eukprot:TRINITY_DN7214_c0_g1_i1.p1 TRINITY_DN7214_c0_g1~~TRINITY_DN7214_c0_g1_i1.p1  ORF type:complete len:1150 (+),score=203.33 TRINITY_DN7214_c0_g1_i1:212-3661(+)
MLATVISTSQHFHTEEAKHNREGDESNSLTASTSPKEHLKQVLGAASRSKEELERNNRTNRQQHVALRDVDNFTASSLVQRPHQAVHQATHDAARSSSEQNDGPNAGQDDLPKDDQAARDAAPSSSSSEQNDGPNTGQDDLPKDDQGTLHREGSTLSRKDKKDSTKKSLVLDLVHVKSTPARSTCWDLLLELLWEDPQNEVSPDLESRIEQDYEKLITYKNRDLLARPLHFAIWIVSNHEMFGSREDAFVGYPRGHEMSLLLSKKADPMSTAYYKRKDEKVELSAMHIAAGLGCICAMELLLESSPHNEHEVLNRYCLKDGLPYYAPLHDAAFCGQKAAAVWLLDKKATPTAKNAEGWTPLHWLACRGLDSAVEDVEDIVKSLLKNKASVREGTADISDRDNANLIPLELAVKPGSLFPKHLLYLLAPSYEALEQGQLAPSMSRGNLMSNSSFFEDLALMSSHSYRAAHDFATKICAHGEFACSKAVADAQRPNSVDCIASLFHMAPEAAACMLGILVETPLMESPGHHGLSSRAVLSGRQMRCDYQPDSKEQNLGPHQLRVSWPLWKFNSDSHTAPPWHERLIRTPPEIQSRSLSVFDVETKALLLPNILDIDIFMAWSSARGVHRDIFKSLPIRGAIQCLWDSLVGPVFHLTLLFHLVDGIVLLAWGLTPAGMPLFSRLSAVDSGSTLPKSGCSEPVLWNLVLASVIREGVSTAWWFLSLCSKWRKHLKNSRSWNVQGHGEDQVLLSGLHTLWHPLKIFDFSHGTQLLDICLCVFKALFLMLLHVEPDMDFMTDWQQALLAVCFFMQALLFVYNLRVSSFGGKKILVLLKTLSSGAVGEVFMVALLILGCFISTAMMLDRSGSVGWVFLSLFRGLLLGDGAGLDNLGFDIESDQRITEDSMMVHLLNLMSILGTITFILILNMVIAIYSTEYSRLESQSDALFNLERARYSCNCLLGLMKLKQNRPFVLWAMRLLWVACLAGVVVILWFFHRQQGPLAVLLAVAQVTLQALMMRSDWFTLGANGSEGPSEAHYLWICYKCDKSEEQDPFGLDSIREQAFRSQADGELELLLSDLKEKLLDMPSKTEMLEMMSRRSPLLSPRKPIDFRSQSSLGSPSPKRNFSAPAYGSSKPRLEEQLHVLSDEQVSL